MSGNKGCNDVTTPLLLVRPGNLARKIGLDNARICCWVKGPQVNWGYHVIKVAS